MSAKRIAILQSNYIPWKGYFDLIASVDEFVLYDDMQFTKNDWRNRNKIKTPRGLEWLTVPTGIDISRRIRDVDLKDRSWQGRHWKSLVANYGRAPCFDEMAKVIGPLYLDRVHTNLSAMNRAFLEAVCGVLGIRTVIKNSWEYRLIEGKTERLVDICLQANATAYTSGPAAREYLQAEQFAAKNIGLSWFDYSGYLEYPQLWGKFEHGVTVLDLLFNCGRDAARYLRRPVPVPTAN